MKASSFFTTKNSIGYVAERFQPVFGDMDIELPKKLDLQTKKLDRPMTDAEILKKFDPEEISLGDLVYAIKNIFERIRWRWYICYIRDDAGVLWAVGAYWREGHGWFVSASSVGRPNGWNAVHQVVSRKFSALGTSDTGSFDLGTLEISVGGKRYKLVEV